jgi:TRAP transporter TAXI family solute receptor
MQMRAFKSFAVLRIIVFAAAFGALFVSCAAVAQLNAERVNQGTVGIVSGGIGGTYVQIANDLANVLDDSEGTIRVLPIVGKGSIQNIIDILYLKGVDIGIVQSDVLTYLRRNNQFPGIERRIHYVTKLYNEEFHLLARNNIQSIQDLAGKQVNFDRRNSGTFLTATVVFGTLNIDVQPTFHDQALAIQKLKAGEIDALVYVAGKPAALFRDLSAEDGVHFVPVAATPELLESYFPSQLGTAEYPRLVTSGADVETIAVGAVMAAFNWDPDSARYRKVARFVDAFFNKLGDLQQAPRHPKWREVSLSVQPPGWTRFRAADEWMRRSTARAVLAEQPTVDPRLRREFDRFLASEQRSGPLDNLTREQREALFQRFVRWNERSGQQ